MTVVVLVCGDDAIGEDASVGVDVHVLVGVEEVFALEAVQRGEHGSLHQVVPVDHRDGVGEVSPVCQLRVDGALLGPLAVLVVFQVERVVGGMLHHRVVHIGAGDVNPGVDVGVLQAKRREVDRVFYPRVRGILRGGGGIGLGSCGCLLGRFRDLGVLPYKVRAAGDCRAPQDDEQHDERRDLRALLAGVVARARSLRARCLRVLGGCVLFGRFRIVVCHEFLTMMLVSELLAVPLARIVGSAVVRSARASGSRKPSVRAAFPLAECLFPAGRLKA